MLQFHLSKILSKDMAQLMSDTNDIYSDAMQWYVHRVTIMRRKCLIAMELQSRYAMVFCGLSRLELRDFPSIFVERLLQEAVFICQQDEEQTAKLAAVVELIGEEYLCQIGSDRSVMAHINQVAEELKYAADRLAGRLPENDEECLGFDVRVNQQLRKRKGQTDYFVPLAIFRDSWLGMLEYVDGQQALHDRRSVKNGLSFQLH